ncbi:hypothetical protein B5K08_08165 [Rhizobium leguminosarum bv. trifolii]|uniref:Uncharacterized protein n=1 Tax=Rhizobium leguminosarum bv. trifolii TaxID=386 RepID=A0A3E1BTV5_RHILT|nr:hypothetical protein B5K08_08165 [Rhizobium leguminosarum bv. trifolii]RFB97651.1 hypothetical protein B5K10_08140 [Rhizobium leguminosarum bv. trifolii]
MSGGIDLMPLKLRVNFIIMISRPPALAAAHRFRLDHRRRLGYESGPSSPAIPESRSLMS